jgi:HTH-type transcriptional regulator/antitoxin HigA
MYQIQSEEEYSQVMEKVESYLQTATQLGGFHMLSAAQRADLQNLSNLAESWEDDIPLMPIAQPKTLVGMIELKMYERKLKQKDLAVLLEISPTRLSEVLQAKRKVNMDLAKRLYKVLKIDPAFILETA